MENYKLHLRLTTLGSPTSGQPHAGGPGAGDVIVDQVIDLRQWVAERGGLAPVEAPVAAANSAVETEPTQPVGPVDPMRAAVAVPGTPPGPSPLNAPASRPVITAKPVDDKPYGSFAEDR